MRGRDKCALAACWRETCLCVRVCGCAVCTCLMQTSGSRHVHNWMYVSCACALKDENEQSAFSYFGAAACLVCEVHAGAMCSPGHICAAEIERHKNMGYTTCCNFSLFP